MGRFLGITTKKVACVGAWTGTLRTLRNVRRVARVLLMWKHFQAGGLGAALRPPMGPGRSPGGAQGAKPPEANGFYTFTE